MSMALRWCGLVVNFLFSPPDEESTLPVVCVDGDLPNELFTIIKEKLALIPDEPKLVIIPGLSLKLQEGIPGTLLVQFPTGRIDGFQAILIEILSKRWQTSDLISVMQEVQRTYPLFKTTSNIYIKQNAKIRIEDTLSSKPRLQKTEESSQ